MFAGYRLPPVTVHSNKIMEEDIKKCFETQEKKLDDIFRSVEKTRKYFLWTMIITIAMVLLPLIGLMVVIPQFLGTLGNAGSMGL